MILYRSRFGEATKTKRQNSISGCGSAWLERLVWDQEVAGSNPVTPTTCGCSSMVEHQPSKLDTWVRFPSPALFFCGKPDRSRLPAVFVLPGLIPGDTRILRGHIVNKTVNTSDIHDRTGRPGNRNGGAYAGRWSRKRT